MTGRRAFALGAALLAASCGSDGCSDPARAGFIAGSWSLASGCYERRSATLDAELAAAEARRDALRAEAASLETTAQTLSSERKLRALRLAAAQRDLADLSGQLDALRRRPTRDDRAELQGTTADATRLMSQAARRDVPASDAELERLEAENRDLRDRIRVLARRLGGALR